MSAIIYCHIGPGELLCYAERDQLYAIAEFFFLKHCNLQVDATERRHGNSNYVTSAIEICSDSRGVEKPQNSELLCDINSVLSTKKTIHCDAILKMPMT